MDDFLTIILTAIVTTLIVAPVAYQLGRRAKNRHWAQAATTLKQHGLFISRRRTQ